MKWRLLGVAAATVCLGGGASAMPGQEVRPAEPVEPASVSLLEALGQLEALRPSEEELFQEALALHRAGSPGEALGLYFEICRLYPEGKRADEIILRVAQGYRELGRFEEARKAIENLRQRPQAGPWLPEADLLEGEMLVAERKFAQAHAPLARAEPKLGGELRRRARFLLIFVAEQTGKLAEVRDVLVALAGTPGPMGDYGRLRLGMLLETEGKADEAKAQYQKVFADGHDDKTKAEAAVRAGNLALAQRDYALAQGYFESARKLSGEPHWQKLAHGGLIFTLFAAGKFPEVIATFQAVRPDFPEQSRPEIFLLVAEAFRLLGRGEEAKTQYEFILREFPQSPQAEAAAWGRLLVMGVEGDKDILPETARYLAKFPHGARVFEVKLMRADALFARGEWKAATRMYEEISQDPAFAQLPQNRQGALHLRVARGAFELKDYKRAAEAGQRFLDLAATDDPARPAVLWLQGQAYQEAGNPKAAFAAWQRLVKDFPDFPEAETALWKTGVLAGSLKKFDQMQTHLQTLLERFPKSGRRAEAHALLGQCARELGRPQEGRAHWEQARELDPKQFYGLATQNLLQLALARGDVDAVRDEIVRHDAWRKTNPKAEPVQPEVIAWTAFALAERGKKAEAVGWFRRAITETKDSAQRQRIHLALCLMLNEIELWTEAVKEWQAFRISFPEDANRSSVLVPLAEAQIGAGDLASARKLAEQILRQNPEGEFNARGRLLLGDLALAEGQVEEAAKFYGAVALLIDHPEITPLALRRARAAWEQAGNRAKAQELGEALMAWERNQR